jgi:hypothetical protein
LCGDVLRFGTSVKKRGATSFFRGDATAINPLHACPQWLKRRLHLLVIALLPLLLAATPAATPAPPHVSRVATATVQIIEMESVSAKPAANDTRAPDRQYRQRENMPLVEFF